MRHIFGPVPSRRLGRSLGIDPVPAKTCSYDCVYCQLGRTTLKTVERREYVPVAEIMAELADALGRAPEIDYITVSGSGEPTLHAGIGEIVRAARSLKRAPVAVLTNGALLDDVEVRRDLACADLVIPSLDAAAEPLFQMVNRPHASLRIDRVIEGLRAFCAEFSGQVWVEVMLVKGMNDGDEEIRRLAKVLNDLNVDRVQLNSVTRPPAEPFALPVHVERLKEVCSFFGERAEVVGRFDRRAAPPPCPAHIEPRIRELTRRRPCTAGELSAVLGLHPGETLKYLESLVKQGTIKVTRHGGELYYREDAAVPDRGR